MLISLILAVVVTILAAYIASNNLAVIDINLVGYGIRGTTGVLVVSAFGIGVLLGVLLMLPALISRSWTLIRHRRQMQDLQDSMKRDQPAGKAEED